MARILSTGQQPSSEQKYWTSSAFAVGETAPEAVPLATVEKEVVCGYRSIIRKEPGKG